MNSDSDNLKQSESRIKKLTSQLKRTWHRMQPDPQVRKGAAWGLILITSVFLVFTGFFETPGLPGFLDAISGSLFFLIIGALVGLAAYMVLFFIHILPRFIKRTGMTALLVLIITFLLLPSLGTFTWLAVLMISLTGAFLGGGLAALLRRDFKYERRIKKTAIGLSILIPVCVLGYIIIWMIHPGNASHLAEPAMPAADIDPLSVPNPDRPGHLDTAFLTYGSGTDKRRPEFGEKVDLLTQPVDAGPFVKGNEGFKMKIRNWYWGFKPEAFPVNGRVWYPKGSGPFPLVLIVHGNHKMEEYSDPGYEYLGKHFASRGYIFVSVDENFFNGGFLSSLSRENDGRAWMLLQHLSVWRAWNQDPDNPFFQKVDMENWGLIGHSRGGEAAAIAGGFNRLPFYPDDASVAFDFNFPIKSIAAIAPSDQQYQPADLPNPLQDVNYLVLQGGHDADVSIFLGARQFNRVKFSGKSFMFKAGIYIYRANHGQFNTVWGDMDYGLPFGLLLNRSPLLSGEQQRKAGMIYLTAFFDSTLKGRTAYLPMFRDHRRILDWLPPDIYISRYQDSTFTPVCEFGEDINLTTASLPGTSIQGKNLAVWREGEMEFRKSGSKQNSAVFLGWRGPAQSRQEKNTPAYLIRLPRREIPEFDTSQFTHLVFSACEADESLPEADGITETPETNNHDTLSFHIELEDASGVTVKKPVDDFMSVPPIITSRFLKIKNESGLYGSGYEPTLQTFHVPLSAFEKEKNGFDVSRLQAIKFIFDRGKEGILILDNIGFSRLPEEQLSNNSVYAY